MTDFNDEPKEAKAKEAEYNAKEKEPKDEGKEPQTEEMQSKARLPKSKHHKAKRPKLEFSETVGAGLKSLIMPIPEEPAEARFPDHDVSPEVAALLRGTAPEYTYEEEAEIISGFITKVRTDPRAKELADALERGEMLGFGR